MQTPSSPKKAAVYCKQVIDDIYLKKISTQTKSHYNEAPYTLSDFYGMSDLNLETRQKVHLHF